MGHFLSSSTRSPAIVIVFGRAARRRSGQGRVFSAPADTSSPTSPPRERSRLSLFGRKDPVERPADDEC